MKLTIKNYKEETKKLDFKKLPEAAREAHNEFDSFSEFYNEDKDIKEMLDNHFKIVESYLKPNTAKSKKWEIIFTNAGGKICASNKLVNENGDYKTVALIHNTTGSIDWRIAKQEVPATVQRKIETFANGVKKRNTKTESATKKKTVSKKTTSPRLAKRKPIEVELMPLEIKIIKRYLNFHDKKVTERQVSLLYKVIQKAATEKTIRKTSKYASEINSIGNDLIKTYRAMDGSCKFEVPSSQYSKLKSIVDDYGVTPAVALIKRFINLYGNITKAKAERLLTSITNSLKNGKVNKSDKEFEQVKNVQKHLNDYLESDKLLVTNVQLKGLQGIAGLGK